MNPVQEAVPVPRDVAAAPPRADARWQDVLDEARERIEALREETGADDEPAVDAGADATDAMPMLATSLDAGGPRPVTPPGAAAPRAAAVATEAQDIASLAFTAQTVVCLAEQDGLRRLRFECEVQGGVLHGARLMLRGHEGQGGLAQIVVALPPSRWVALAPLRAELARALGAALPGHLVVELVADAEGA